MNKKPWYWNDIVIIFAITTIMISLIFTIIFYLEVICQPK